MLKNHKTFVKRREAGGWLRRSPTIFLRFAMRVVGGGVEVDAGGLTQI